MDFTLTDSQDAVVALGSQIFSGQVTLDRIKEIEKSDDRFDRRLWSELAKANILGLCLPEDDGGSGLGVTELSLILEQQGRRLAQVPLLWTQVAALTIAEFAPPALRGRILPGVVGGDIVLTVGLSEAGVGDPFDPGVTATADGDGWRLSGTKPSVPYAHVSGGVLISARVSDSS